MQVTVKTLGDLQREMTVVVPVTDIDNEVETRLQQLSGRVKIDGFRPGKVPMTIVKQRYGAGVREEVTGDVLNRSFQNAVMQEQLRIAGMPEFDAATAVEDEHLQFVAKFEVYPEFEPADVSSIQIARPVAEVLDENVDAMIETLREQRKVYAAVDRASAEGDQVTIDFVGSIDGVEFDGGKGEAVSVTLGEGRMIKDFEQALYGLKADEETTFDVTFPDDYPAENLKGQGAQFSVTVKQVAAAQLPEIDDEFAKSFGADSVDGMRAEVRNNMQRELTQGINNRLKDQVMDGLVSINDVTLPAALVKEETSRMKADMVKQMGGQSQIELPDDLFKDQAERRVKLGLVIGEMVRAQSMTLSKDSVDSVLDGLAAGYEDPQGVKDYYRSNQQAMQNVEGMALEQQIVDYVIEQATVTDEPSDFDAIMNPAPKAE